MSRSHPGIDRPKTEQTSAIENSYGKVGSRDLSRIALFISLLAVIFSSILFYALNRNITGMNDSFTRLEHMEERIAALDVEVRNGLSTLGNRLNTEAGGVETSLGNRIDILQSRLDTVEQELQNSEWITRQAHKALRAETFRLLAGQLDYLANNAESPEETESLKEALKALETARGIVAE